MKHVAEQVLTRFEWDDGTWHESDLPLTEGTLPLSRVEFHTSCSGRVPSLTMWELLAPTAAGQPRYGLVYDGPCSLPIPESPEPLPGARAPRMFEAAIAAIVMLGGLVSR